jgi:hypothetical protein
MVWCVLMEALLQIAFIALRPAGCGGGAVASQAFAPFCNSGGGGKWKCQKIEDNVPNTVEPQYPAPPKITNLIHLLYFLDRLCGLVVRVPGYRSRGRVRFPALPDFLRSSGSETGSTQPREYKPREYKWSRKWPRKPRLRADHTTPSMRKSLH